MTGLLALSLTVLGFALLHAAATARGPLSRWRRGARAPAWAMRVAAGLCIGASLRFWGGHGGWATGALVGAAALLVVAGAFVLLEPVAPKVAWGIAFAAPAVALACAVLGGAHAG